MKDDLSEDQDYNLWVLLHQARDVIFKAREKELREYGISTRQAAVLFVVNAIEGKANIGDIARWLLREPHTISVNLNRMGKEGLISKVRGSSKKSQVNIVLTKKGQEAYTQSVKRESIQGIMSCLSEEEHQQLYSSLKKLRDKGLKNLTAVRNLPFP